MKKIHEAIPLCREFNKITGINPWAFQTHIITAATGKFSLDICKLDEEFDKRDADYDSDKATYKGENVSMTNYIVKKWGERANQIIEALI